MSITINDPVLLEQLRSITGPTEAFDPNGVFLGTFQTIFGIPPKGYIPPISDEEMRRRRETYRDGKPLSEILKRLEGMNK